MDYTELIHDFADGSLSVEREEELFLAMSSNEDYRSELKQQIAMKNAISKDRVAFVPPAESTMKVFSALGFSTVGALSGGVVAQSFGSRVVSFLAQYTPALITGVITSVAASVVTLMSLNPSATKDNSFASNNTNNTPVQKTEIATNNNIPDNSINTLASAEPKVRTVVKYVYVDRPVEKIINVSDNASNLADNKLSSNSSNPISTANTDNSGNNPNSNLVTNIASNPDSAPPIANSEIKPPQKQIDNSSSNQNFSQPSDRNVNQPTDSWPDDKKEYSSHSAFALEFRGNQSFFFKRPPINPTSIGKFANSGIGLFYQLSNSFLIGLDLRQETFYQKFQGKTTESKVYQIEQQPNFISTGLSLRYKPVDLNYKGFTPYSQLLLGGNQAGFIYRGLIGLTYSPYSTVSFVLAGEYSGFVFHHQSTMFYADKFGMNYGVVIMF